MKKHLSKASNVPWVIPVPRVSAKELREAEKADPERFRRLTELFERIDRLKPIPGLSGAEVIRELRTKLAQGKSITLTS